ncbi:MAG: glycosyltransferase family 2 protein [Deltaproteobacteria bacterium]|nr:glycosyltransferase family 2 protein [Deltaproteobacteria bacterium]
MTAMAGKGIIVIPVFNEAENIAGVIGEIRAEGLGLDIVVVDDGSSDRTRQVLCELPVQALSHPINLGYGVAVQTGMLHAVRRGYDFLVLMDGDGQHVPGEIPKLLAGLEEGADIVIGSRILSGSESYTIPPLRRAAIRFFSFLAKALGGVDIRDVTSGFQAMRRDVFSFLAREYPVDFPDAEVVVMLGLKKFTVAEVPTQFRRRERGISMYSSLGTVLYYPFKSFLASVIVLLRLFRERREG